MSTLLYDLLEELCAASQVERRKYQWKDPIRQLLVLQLLLEAERGLFLNSVHTAAVIQLGRKFMGTRD